MKQPIIQRQVLSNVSRETKAHNGKSIKEILSGLFFCFFTAALAYMFFVKQVEAIDQQAEIAYEYQAQFKDSTNERNY